MKSRSTQLLGAVLIVLLGTHLVLLGFFQLSDEDTWWHLKEGELYVTTGSLPDQDPFAFTTAGREWIKYSWLADSLFYGIYRAAGLRGLVLFRLLALFLVTLILYGILRGCGLHPLAAILLVFLASVVLRLRLLIRPELISFLLLLAVLAILLEYRHRHPWWAYALLPLQALWTNVHASFVFGIALPGLVLLANLLPGTRVAPGWGRLELDRAHLRHLALVTAALPFASLLNPNGLSLVLFPVRQNRMAELTWFGEWKQVWHLPRMDPVWWDLIVALTVVIAAFVVVSALLACRERRVDPVGWGILLAMGTYAVLRNRAAVYFVLALLPLLALALARAGEHLASRGGGERRTWLERVGAFACLLVLSGSIADQAVFTPRHPFGFGVRKDYFPEGAVPFLARHGIEGRIFNSYGFGGYLIWRRWPANQVLIDGRYDTILFDETLLEAYRRAHQSPEALARITAAYDIQILVLDAEPVFQIPFLRAHPDWARVYWDPIAEIFLRRGGRYAQLIERHEYRLTRPAFETSYLVGYRSDPDTWGRAVAELQRAVRENPENSIAWLGLAQEYRAAGPAAAEARLQALQQVEALLPGAPARGRILAEEAEALLHLGRLAEAEAAARRALGVQGDLLLPRSVLAATAERRSDWPQAREQLQALLDRLPPDDPRAPGVRERLATAERGLRGLAAR